jgi:polysaccharide biosynthesis transport protein
MSRPDHSEEPTPNWQQAGPPALPSADPWEEIPDLGAPTAKALNVKLIWRAARRHWWQILVLWFLLSAGLMALAYTRIKTNHTATALLIIRSTTPRIFDMNSSGVGDLSRYQKTQVELVTSPDVLADTLVTHPDLAALNVFQGSPDPEAEIRRLLQVEIRKDTNLIAVSMTAEDRKEAVLVVEKVVEAYLKIANRWSAEESQTHITRLQKEANKLNNEITQKRATLRNLVERLGNVDPTQLKDQGRVSLERYNNYLSNLDMAKLRRIELESKWESAKLRAGRVAAPAPQQMSAETVKQMFYNHPRVIEVVKDRDKVKQRHEDAKRIVAKGRSDPALKHHQDNLAALEGQIKDLWKELGPSLQKSVDVAPDDNDKLVAELEAEVSTAKTMENALYEELHRMEVENKQSGGEALEALFARAELDKDGGLLMQIQGQIRQFEFDATGPAKVEQANKLIRVDPSTNKRMKVMAATPAGVLGVLLALFVLVEVRSGRVGDPDELTSRVRLEVIGVVPPLPSLRPSRALWGSRDEVRARRQFEEFIQSLDHLRVALCASRKGGHRRRCVVITSACSSEGKTTLAAHLAGRCANAGLSTLLIDADLRNPSLSRLLKVPEGPGLTDVLRGEVSAESAMMVIEAGGGFHLLPAGTPGYDPSRLLQTEQLSQLVGQFREAFDIVIMDAPPVLLVPDALTVGRCSDGVLLAVRYDTSRFPLVERAHRRLAAVGVPVIGAVVNGVRSMESSYGYYSYSYSYRADRPSGSSSIDVPAEPTA